MKQKILCIILSAVLCLSQAGPAFAVQVYEAEDTSGIAAESYEIEEDAENIPSEGFTDNPETVPETDSSPEEIIEPADEIEEPATTFPGPAGNESDSENTKIDSTVPSPVIDEVIAESEQDE